MLLSGQDCANVAETALNNNAANKRFIGTSPSLLRPLHAGEAEGWGRECKAPALSLITSIQTRPRPSETAHTALSTVSPRAHKTDGHPGRRPTHVRAPGSTRCATPGRFACESR